MKKTLLFIIAAAALSFCGISKANAQEIFHKGNQTASVLVGLGVYNNGIPPIVLSYEYCVADNLINGNNGSIGVGAEGGYFAIKYGNKTVNSWLHSGLVGGRASFHYQFVDKLDTYAGLFLGAILTGGSTNTLVVGDQDVKVNNNSDVSASFGWGVHFGARYYFVPNFAINAELGYGFSIANLGVTFRF